MDLSGEPLYEQESDSHANRQAAQRAARSLAASVAKMHGAVPLPLAVQRLLAATETTDYRIPEIVAIIESDPSLAGRIMRQVNSALYGRAPCTSIAQAVTLLGARMLRATAITASALELFGKEEEPVALEVAEHGVRTGTIARRFAVQCGLSPDEMYTCGLLHDVGKLMLLRGSDLDYPEMLSRARAFEQIHVVEREKYGFDHALLAGHVLGAWKLPHPLPRIVAWHHQPERAYRGQGQLPRRVALLRVADMLSHLASDAGFDEAWAQLGQMRTEVELLELSEEVLIELCAELLPTPVVEKTPSPGAAELGRSNGARGHAPGADARGSATRIGAAVERHGRLAHHDPAAKRNATRSQHAPELQADTAVPGGSAQDGESHLASDAYDSGPTPVGSIVESGAPSPEGPLASEGQGPGEAGAYAGRSTFGENAFAQIPGAAHEADEQDVVPGQARSTPARLETASSEDSLDRWLIDPETHSPFPEAPTSATGSEPEPDSTDFQPRPNRRFAALWSSEPDPLDEMQPSRRGNAGRAVVAGLIFLLGALLGRAASDWFRGYRSFVLWTLLGSAAVGLLVSIFSRAQVRRSAEP